MFCPRCGAAVGANQKFCTECGASLAAAFTIVEQTEPPRLDTPAASAPVTAPTPVETSAQTVTEEVTATVPVGAPRTAAPVEPFRLTPLLVLGVLAAGIGIASALVEVVAYKVTLQPGDVVPVDVSLVLNDLSTSHVAGACIAGLLIVIGAVVGAGGHPIGTGLAGGAGIALAGMLLNAGGLAVAQLDAAEIVYLHPGATVTTSYDFGFFLVLIAAGLGTLVFVLALVEVAPRPDAIVPVWIGAVGTLATLAVLVGTLLPLDGADFGDNFTSGRLPPITLYMRLVVLLFIVLGGVAGFLANRRWGAALALGAISVGVWQWFAALVEIGDLPMGIAGGYTLSGGAAGELVVPFLPGNLFGTDTTPELLTSIGVVGMVVAAAAGLVSARRRST